MKQFLSDYKAKVLVDIHLFLDYWYVWVGILVILIGLYWIFTRLKGKTDG